MMQEKKYLKKYVFSNKVTIDEQSNAIEPWHVISNNVAFWQVQTQTSLCSLILSSETLNHAQ